MNTQEELLVAEEQMVQEEFNRLLDDYFHTNHRRKIERITKAFNFAHQAHKGVRRTLYHAPSGGSSHRMQ